MTVALAVISDRVDKYLPACLESLFKYRPVSFDQVVTVDDREHRLGLAGAVQQAWSQVETDFVFHVEEDFVFTETVPVDAMQRILEGNQHLAQLVLKRQPWSPEECAAGGIVERNPSMYQECSDGTDVWTEHHQIFSLNPCLIPRRVIDMGWPASNEAGFTSMCVEAGLRFAFYGGKFDPSRVLHVGAERASGWKL